MSEPKKIALLHGCNLNLLGDRNPELYGTMKLRDLERELVSAARRYNIHCITFQSNYEGALVEKIQELRRQLDGMIINPGAWTHYSYAIHDALEMVEAPIVEVHITDIAARKEDWRHHSVISDVCELTISGKGMQGYSDALKWLIDRLKAAPGR